MNRLPACNWAMPRICPTETKNIWYCITYLCWLITALVKRGTFLYLPVMKAYWHSELGEELTVSFLQIGPTNNDIHLTFSCTSGFLWALDAVTLQDLQSEVFQVYNKTLTVCKSDQIANLLRFSADQKWLQGVRIVSHYGRFKCCFRPNFWSFDIFWRVFRSENI